jgi:glycosyltransferase involved in cell wall biosynthesis
MDLLEIKGLPRILLLTSHPPGSIGIGGAFLSALCRVYPHNRICCFAPSLAKLHTIAADMKWMPIELCELPRQHGIRRLGHTVEKLTTPLTQQVSRMTQCLSLVKRAVEFGQAHDVDLVWAVLDHPAIIGIANEITTQLKARLVTMVWDPPELLMDNLHYDLLSRRITMQAFARLLRRAESCAVASELMKEEYHQRYHVAKPLVMIKSGSNRIVPASKLKSADRFVIGFAGSLYATREWDALLNALSSINWQLESRQISIRFLGNNLSLRARSGMVIDFLGWRPADETLQLLSECDIAYLPYWLDEKHSQAVRLCFPNKLSTYIAAGLPVLYHGPADSSPAHFMTRFPVGLCCQLTEAQPIVETLRRFITDPELYSSAVMAGQQALDEYLHPNTFYAHFAELLNIDGNELSI